MPDPGRTEVQKAFKFMTLIIFVLNCIMDEVLLRSFLAVSFSRPDLMDNYLALILSAFIRNGLLEVKPYKPYFNLFLVFPADFFSEHKNS